MHQSIALFRSRSVPLLVAVLAVAACARSDSRSASVPESARVGDKGPGGGAASTGDATSIIVNGVALAAETIRQLQQVYPVTVPPGRYWYDPVSGVWGVEGSPVSGQMAAGLALGGPLSPDASRGTSGVFINGRQITLGEKVFIERLCLTPVVPARYWILPNGVGGLEGGAAFFNLGQCPGVAQQNSGPRSSSRTYCDANGACTTSGILGTITTVPE